MVVVAVVVAVGVGVAVVVVVGVAVVVVVGVVVGVAVAVGVVVNRSTVGLLVDGDTHAKEVAMLANYLRDGIDLGQPTRDHFTIQDAIELGAMEDDLDICQECGFPAEHHDTNCQSDPAYARYWEHVYERRRLGDD